MEKRHVFISYKVEDFSQADSVRAALEANGFPCWMAPMSLPGGSSYAVEIPKAIKNAACVVLILSSRAQTSKWVSREIDRALNENVTVLPFVIEDCLLTPEFEFYLTNVQRYAAFDDYEGSLKRLLANVASLCGSDRTDFTTTPSPKAAENKPRRTGVIVAVCALIAAALCVGGWFLLRTPPAKEPQEQPAVTDETPAHVIATVDEFHMTAVAAAEKTDAGTLWEPASLTQVSAAEDATLYRVNTLIDGVSCHVAFQDDNSTVVCALTGLSEENYERGLELAKHVSVAVYNVSLDNLPDVIDDHETYPVEKLSDVTTAMEAIGFADVMAREPDTTFALKYKHIQADADDRIRCEIRTGMLNGNISYDLILRYEYHKDTKGVLLRGDSILHNEVFGQ